MNYNIVTMKWGSLYGADYVNRLHSATKRHLTLPHQFICFTDDPTGLNSEIIAHSIPEIDLPPKPKITGWRKLGLFRPDLPINGTCLFLDLDIVIVGSLDDFFTYAPGKIPIIHNWTSGLRAILGSRPEVGNSTCFRFEANKQPFVVDQFEREREWALAHFRPPQTYLTHCIRPDMTYWPEHWVRSFKRHCRHTFPLNLALTPRLPRDARIIAFHGRPNPDEVINGYRGKRIHHHTRPTPWVAENWR
jgi:hypothetical protein